LSVSIGIGTGGSRPEIGPCHKFNGTDMLVIVAIS
jgi:hypothetical protein